MPDYSSYARVKNGEASRTPLPVELSMAPPEALLDLDWLPDGYGVRGCQWWPIEDQSTPLDQYQSYGDETLTLDAARKVVVSIRPVIIWTAEQILAYKASIPRYISKLAFRNRFTQPEKIAFEMAQVDDPTAAQAARLAAAGVRVMEKDLAVSQYADLNDAVLQAALGQLELFAVLGTGRADEIIWGDIQPNEVP